MGFERKFNNYTISNFEEKSSKKIKAFFIDIDKRKIMQIEVLSDAETFLKNNKFFQYEIKELETFSKKNKKQIAIFSIDKDLLQKNIPFEINGLKIYSNCLICSCLRYKLEIRHVQITENELSEMVKF